jgi:hypothetical protein
MPYGLEQFPLLAVATRKAMLRTTCSSRFQAPAIDTDVFQARLDVAIYRWNV